jgi:hypothetical protein
LYPLQVEVSMVREVQPLGPLLFHGERLLGALAEAPLSAWDAPVLGALAAVLVSLRQALYPETFPTAGGPRWARPSLAQVSRAQLLLHRLAGHLRRWLDEAPADPAAAQQRQERQSRWALASAQVEALAVQPLAGLRLAAPQSRA